MSTFSRWRAWGAAIGLTLAAAGAAAERTTDAAPLDVEAVARALERASRAVVGVSATASDDARSIATQGREREGSGVVIDRDGLVLTIGYLVLETEQVQLEIEPERIVPARVVAFDVATGFGLLRPLVPLRVEPVALARANPDPEQPLMVASGGRDAVVGLAKLMSQRPFSGSWEYHVERALYTAPQHPNHSGAGLFNLQGELVGIGSLAVADTLPADDPRQVPGNMFVPVDLLAPILDEMLARGASTASRRAWLGVNCVERDGQLRVVRVSPDSPAELAGVDRGDRFVAIDGTPVASLDALWKTLWAGGQPEREVTLEIRRGDETRMLKVQTVDRMQTYSRARGV
ncbi:MAG: S1C family serine protease [Burkholderiaceae bacterium]|nr:S1C family serine protease [Burkholderiaceae bacterium]